MNKFSGYKIDSTNIRKIEAVLLQAKLKIKEAAEAEYHRLLSKEISSLVDDVALGVIKRPECPLFDAAINSLNERISNTENLGISTEYDLRSAVSIVPDKKETFLIFTASNPVLEEAFESTPGIIPYTFDLDEEEASERAVKWKSLQKSYGDKPFVFTPVLTSRMEASVDKVEFETVKERALTRAIHNVTSKILNMYAAGKTIPNNRLLDYLDQAMTASTSEKYKQEILDRENELLSILPEITKELVMSDPRKPIEEKDA